MYLYHRVLQNIHHCARRNMSINSTAGKEKKDEILYVLVVQKPIPAFSEGINQICVVKRVHPFGDERTCGPHPLSFTPQLLPFRTLSQFQSSYPSSTGIPHAFQVRVFRTGQASVVVSSFTQLTECRDCARVLSAMCHGFDDH